MRESRIFPLEKVRYGKRAICTDKNTNKEIKMRGMLEGITAILLAAVMMAAIPTEAEAKIYEDTVRLHILANSDEKDDQQVKIYIRNRLLSVYGATLSQAKSAQEAREKMQKILPNMERDASAWLAEAGFSYGARVTLTDEWFDRREYADAVFPEGRYASLLVTLGDGEGKNWWCVMFPPLCLDMSLGDTLPYSGEEQALIGGKYRVKLKTLELAAQIFR